MGVVYPVTLIDTNLYGAYGRDRDTFYIFVVLSVNLTTAWSCCLGSSTFSLSNAKDYACIGNIVLEKRACKQSQVTLSMASLLGIFLGRTNFLKLYTVRVYCTPLEVCTIGGVLVRFCSIWRQVRVAAAIEKACVRAALASRLVVSVLVAYLGVWVNVRTQR